MGLLIPASLGEFLATAADRASGPDGTAEDGFGDLLVALFASLDGSHDGVAGDQEGQGDALFQPPGTDAVGENGESTAGLSLSMLSPLLSMEGEPTDAGEVPSFAPADVLEFLLEVSSEDGDIHAVEEIAALLGLGEEGDAAFLTVADGAADPDASQGGDDAEALFTLQRQRGSPGVPIGSPDGEESVVRNVGNADETAAADTSGAPLQMGDSKPANPATGPTAAAGLSTVSTAAPAGSNATPGAPQFVPPQPVPAAQVGQAIIDRVAQGGGEARIHLDPPELGEVLIRVRTEGDRVRIEVHVERSEAAQVLRSSSNDLSNLLGQRGLNLEDVSVNHGGRQPEQQHSEGSGDAHGESEGQSFASVLGIDESDGGDVRAYNLLRSVYNPDGAYLFRV